jgi:hypothetical protein
MESIDYDGLMQVNAVVVFSERDPARRLDAIRELYSADAILTEPEGSPRGRPPSAMPRPSCCPSCRPWSRSRRSGPPFLERFRITIAFVDREFDPGDANHCHASRPPTRISFMRRNPLFDELI